MWMKRSITHPRLQTFLPGIIKEESLSGKGEAQRVSAEIASLISLLTPAAPSLLPQFDLSNYPWCFVMPASGISAGLYLTGAFVPTTETASPAVVCVLLHSTDMVRLLNRENCLPFWMMRSLSTLARYQGQRHVCEEIQADCHELVALSLPSPWRSKLSGPAKQSHIQMRLSDMRCDADFELEGKRGVDVMPWRNWPECVSESEFLWLWRQNRHGKIIESQRKSIVNPVI